MKKVKSIWYKENENEEYLTGLYLELEDGKILAHASSDVLGSFLEANDMKLPGEEKIDPN